MIRIGLVGCGHIGTVHAYALQQLADAELVDARARPRRSTPIPNGPRRSPRHHGGEPRRDARRSCSTRSTSCGSARGPPRTSPRSKPRPIAGLPIFCEKPLAPDLADARRASRPRSSGCRTRSASCCGGRRCSANSRRAVASGEYGRAARGGDARRPVLPDPGPLRLDLAQGRRARGRRHAHRALDPRRRRAALDRSAIRSRSSARTAYRFGYPGIEDTAAATFTYADGSVAQLTSVWHQVLQPRVEPAARGVLREGAALDRRRLPRAAARPDRRRRAARSSAEPPEWSGRFTLPEVYAKALAQYAEPSKAFLDALAGSRRRDGPAPSAVATRARRCARRAPARRPVYRSAADGGAPKSVSIELSRGTDRSRTGPRVVGPCRLRENGGHAALRRRAKDPPRDRGAAQRDRSRARRAGFAHDAVPAFGADDPLGGARSARRSRAARLHVRVARLGRARSASR